ncbi:MAG: TIGR01212 family radical SAM protein [Oceanipulchritudo sp.]
MPSPRYRRLKDYWTALKGGRVQKVSLHAGFTCPNRDGTIGTGGCRYCSNEAFTPAYCHEAKSVEVQIEAGLSFQKRRYPRARGFLGYLQAYTNSHGPIEELTHLYGRILAHPELDGLIIGTRPDCLPDELLDWLQAADAQKPVYIELGIESFSNDILQRMNRGHTIEESEDALARIAARGLPAGGHFLLGFPGEQWESFFDNVARFNRLPLHSVKLHQLHVFRDTPLASYYANHPEAFRFPEKTAYLTAVAHWLTRISPELHIDRIAGDAPPGFAIGPSWGVRLDALGREFEALLEELDIHQGSGYLKPETGPASP